MVLGSIMRRVKAPGRGRSKSKWFRKPREPRTSSFRQVAKLVYNVPVSRPGDFLCEVVDGNSRKLRYITDHAKTVYRFERGGAVVWEARSGGWVRKDA